MESQYDLTVLINEIARGRIFVEVPVDSPRFKYLIFNRLKEEKPNELNKLVAVDGDIGIQDLGMAADVRCEISNVQIVIHSAAVLKMDIDIKTAVQVNFLGTRNTVAFAEKLANLQAFVYVSTSYVHTGLKNNQIILNEEPVPVPYEEKELLLTISRLNRRERKRVAPCLRGRHRNWYSASKTYAELAVTMSNNIPRAIVRPTSVSAAWQEPEPGFNDSKISEPNILSGAYLGIFRRLPLGYTMDYIPVDVVANLIIAAGWELSIKSSCEIRIYQAANSENEGRDKTMIDQTRFMVDYPSSSAILYPKLKGVRNKKAYYCSYFLYHLLPAILIAVFLRLQGKPSRAFRSQMKYLKAIEEYMYFGSSRFHFGNRKMLNLYQQIQDDEKSIFYMNIPDINWKIYYKDMMLGVRRYLLKETDENIVLARKKLRFLRLVNFTFECLFYFLIWGGLSIATGYPLVYLIWAPVGLFFALYLIC